jgi:hypothetical protein
LLRAFGILRSGVVETLDELIAGRYQELAGRASPAVSVRADYTRVLKREDAIELSVLNPTSISE